MSSVNILVDRIDTKTVNTKFGPKPTYAIIGTDGTRYSCGFKKPGVSSGMTVTGIVSSGRYGMEIDPASIVMAAPGSVPSVPSPKTETISAPTSRAGSTGSRPFPIPKMHGDQAIIRQNSLGHAVATVADYVATQPTDKWPDLETWVETVIKVAYKYAEFSSGQRELSVYESLAKSGMEAAEIQEAIDAHNKSSLELPTREADDGEEHEKADE